MATPTIRRPARVQTGLVFVLLSSASFGLSGPLAKSMLEVGWSPGAVVLLRIGGAAIALLLPCLLLFGRTWRPTRQSARRLTVYGIAAIAGAQLCYFSAVQYLSVAVALLIEFTAPVLLILWRWLRTRRRPGGGVLIGAALAMGGLALVLDLAGDLEVSPIGILWGFGAALGCCCYFLLGEADGEGDSVPPLVMTTAGTLVGAAVLALAGIAQVLPMRTASTPTQLAGLTVPWVVPAAGLVLITAVVAYVAGIMGIRRLGSAIASFVGLTEVLFAVLFAILLVGQIPTWTQGVGGLLVIAGIAVVQRKQERPVVEPDPVLDLTAGAKDPV